MISHDVTMKSSPNPNKNKSIPSSNPKNPKNPKNPRFKSQESPKYSQMLVPKIQKLSQHRSIDSEAPLLVQPTAAATFPETKPVKGLPKAGKMMGGFMGFRMALEWDLIFF